MPAHGYDLHDQRFGRLYVEKLDYSLGVRAWLCRCDCGNTKVVRASDLISGKTQSCGCYMRERISECNTVDMIGKRIGLLTVLEKVGPSENGDILWKCQCDCGRICTVVGYKMRIGETSSCGCLAGRPGGFRDLLGERFGKLTVKRFASEKRGDHQNHWECLCDCGNIIFATTGALTFGSVRSCGCARDQALGSHFRTHGMSNTRLYDIWQAMKKRCDSPDTEYADRYWALGITYTAEWCEFMPFYTWALSAGYADNLTLDRINPFGDYTEANCRWITREDQSRNRRKDYLNRASRALLIALRTSCPFDYQDKLRPILTDTYNDSYFSKLFKTLNYDALDSTSMKMLEEFLDAYCTAIVLLNLIANLPTFTQSQDIIDSITTNAISTCDSLNTQFLANNWPLPAFQSKEG